METQASAEASGPAASGGSRLVNELSEDLDVAIGEFLERYPRTSPRAIREAIRLVERRRGGGAARRAASAVALLAAWLVGVLLGWTLG